MLANADGSFEQTLVSIPDKNPIAWSPDGSQFVFSGNSTLHVVSVEDGDSTLSLTDTTIIQLGLRNIYRPAWSPDGAKIAFEARGYDTGSGFEIYVVNADGTDLQRLTDDCCAFDPTWSPDGSRIAFASIRGKDLTLGFLPDISVMDADGSNVTNLTDDDVYDFAPDWSPDGSKIAFVKATSDNLFIHTINPDGTGMTPIAGDTWIVYSVAWSPDGAKFAFPARAPEFGGGEGALEIYVMDIDGSNMTRLTDNRWNDHYVSWRPPPPTGGG